MAKIIIPNSTPQQKIEATLAILEKHGVKDQVRLLGVRGYFLNSMGDPNTNQRGIYDDAIFIVAPDFYAAFNANTDPGAYRKGIASLATGLWKYKIGIHGLSKPKELQYKALVQADKVTVHRDGGKIETGMFGINIHRGGYETVSSLGCQTIYPKQWKIFINAVEMQLTKHKQKVIPYLLIENV